MAVSGHAIPRSARKPQARLAPPLRRAPPGQQSGQPPGSSQANPKNLVSMPPYRITTLSNGESLSGLLMQRLPDPHLTHLVRLFPHRSPRWPSASAAEGGLKPPPEGRLRRACNPSSFAQHRSRSLNQQATSSVRGTQRYSKPHVIDKKKVRGPHQMRHRRYCRAAVPGTSRHPAGRYGGPAGPRGGRVVRTARGRRRPAGR